jgi:flagellar protein FliJ
MKRFKFRLEKVLNIRKFKEDRILNELGRIRGAISLNLQLKQDYLDEAERAMHTMHDERMVLGSGDIIAYQNFRSGLKLKADRQDVIVAELRETEKKALVRYMDARRERMILDKLKEKKVLEYEADMRKLEKKQLNDLITQSSVREIEEDRV